MRDSLFMRANYAEAALWSLIGLGFFAYGIKRRTTRARPFVAGLVFMLFGLSDVAEVRTGAWWTPLWLAAWKGVCLAILLGLLA